MEQRSSVDEEEQGKTARRIKLQSRRTIPKRIPDDTSKLIQAPTWNEISGEIVQRYRSIENWSSDEEEQSKTVGNIKKPPRRIPDLTGKLVQNSHLWNAIPEERRKALTERARKKKTGYDVNENWVTIEEEIAKLYRSSSSELDRKTSSGSQGRDDVAKKRSSNKSLKDKVSTSECKGSEPGSGSQGSSGMLRPVIFFDYEIHEATNNLSDSSKIGEGGYGSVYKGYIDDTDVAIKMLSNTGYQGIKEFHREIGYLGLVRHANLVNLIGTCFQLRALVYEYLPNGSLEDCLEKKPALLTWQIRTRIIYEICTTLRFLHANLPDPLVHGNLKSHNVLLNANFKTKFADFGLYRFLTQGEKSHMMKTFDGSTDYIDPVFLESGEVRPAIDIYSFGKTIIRILTRENPTAEISRTVHEARRTRSLMSIVDPAARGWPEEIVELLAHFALRCCKRDRYNPEFMNNFRTDLQMMLDDIVDA